MVFPAFPYLTYLYCDFWCVKNLGCNSALYHEVVLECIDFSLSFLRCPWTVLRRTSFLTVPLSYFDLSGPMV